MKVYSRILIDIASGRVLEADSYDYEGPVAECKGGSGQQTSTTTTALPAWLQPYAEKFIGGYDRMAFDEAGNFIGKPDDLNQQVAGFTPYQHYGMSNIGNMTPGMQNFANTGIDEAGATISGAYLNPETNPYLRATYDQAARGLTDQYSLATAPSIMASAQKTGNFGGSAMDEAMALSRYDLGQNLGNLATDIYGGNYNRERGNQLQTLNMMPQTMQAGYMPQQTVMGVGALQQQQNQMGLDTDYMNRLAELQFPFEIASGYGGALGQAGSGAGTSSTKAGGASGGGMFGK